MHCFARQCFEDIQLEKSTASRFKNKIVYKKKKQTSTSYNDVR